MQQIALESLDLADLAQSDPNDLVMDLDWKDYNSYEIEQIIEIVSRFYEDQQDIFIYDVVYKFSIEKIADILVLDKVYVGVTIKQIQKALVRAGCSSKNWEVAMYDFMSNRILMQSTQWKAYDLSYDEREVKRVQKIMEAFDEREQEVFHYYHLFEYKVSEICNLLSCDETYISDCLKKYNIALKETDPKYWSKAAHAFVWKKVSTALQQPNKELSTYEIETSKTEALEQQETTKIHWFSPIHSYVKVASIFLIFLVTSVTTGYAMFRFGLIMIPHEKSSDIYVNGDENELEVVETLNLPEYLPNGFTFMYQVGSLHENNSIETVYEDANNELIFQQSINSSLLDLDNENGTTKEIAINDFMGLYKETKNVQMLAWADGDYFYLLYAYSPILKEEELTNIARSVKETENEKE